jgi:hypothetical protein
MDAPMPEGTTGRRQAFCESIDIGRLAIDDMEAAAKVLRHIPSMNACESYLNCDRIFARTQPSLVFAMMVQSVSDCTIVCIGPKVWTEC